MKLTHFFILFIFALCIVALPTIAIVRDEQSKENYILDSCSYLKTEIVVMAYKKIDDGIDSYRMKYTCPDGKNHYRYQRNQ